MVELGWVEGCWRLKLALAGRIRLSEKVVNTGHRRICNSFTARTALLDSGTSTLACPDVVGEEARLNKLLDAGGSAPNFFAPTTSRSRDPSRSQADSLLLNT